VATKVVGELNQSNESSDTETEGIQHNGAELGESLKKWENKVMHGQYIRSMERQLIGEEDTFLWQSRGDLKGETESEIIAAQDQALRIKYHATKILQTETHGICGLCKQFYGIVEHIVSACPILAKEQYIKRHDTVGAELHFNTSMEIWVKLDNKHWYDHVQCQNQSKQVTMARLPYNGTSDCEPPELFLTINRTS
jgi:hypothetical protein